MNSRFKPISRLTIIFILAVVISGSLLTYFSINNISNLKELTEKRILEEQKELASSFSDAIQHKIEILASDFKTEIDKTDLLKDSLLNVATINEFITLPFILNRSGDIIYPNFVGLTENLYRPYLSNRFQYNYEEGEKAEFSHRDFNAARRYYTSCLKSSTTGQDSVKALNVLGRLAVKTNEHETAFRYYRLIISDYNAELSPNGNPYAHYAILQLLKISSPANMDDILPLVEFCLGKMKSGSIPLNFNTEELLRQIVEWTKDKGIQEGDKTSPIYRLSQNLTLQIQFINENKNKLKGLLKEGALDQYSTVGNGYKAVNTFSKENGELLLINTNFEHPAGLLIDGEKLFESTLQTSISPGFESDYIIEFKSGYHSYHSGHNLIYTTQLNPYFPGHMIQVRLKDKNLIKTFITRRSWIYGIALVLLLVGMFLGVALILRDISRQKQIARLRSDFISNVTHELKTPLTSIHMFAESLSLNRVKSPTAKKEYLSIIIKESQRLKRMINNILEFSKIEKGKSDFHFVDSNLADLIKTVIDEMNYWIEEKNFELKTKLDGKIIARIDPEQMKQAIANLLSNAIKYSGDSRSIHIRLFSESDRIHIEVEDHGIGITEKEQARIFEQFYRAGQNKSEGISGTGLGLTVVKGVVEAHKGKVGVKSKVGKGSIFSIILDEL